MAEFFCEDSADQYFVKAPENIKFLKENLCLLSLI